MSDAERHVRAPSAESLGEAPGRARLNGRKILVVGGGQRVTDAASDPIGNGRAMSVLFAREGAHVAVCDINPDSARETAALIGDELGQAAVIQADVSKTDDCVRLVQEAHEAMGGVDGIVCNVGVGLGGLGLAGAEPDSWDKTFAINVRAPMLICRAAMPIIADGSSILFISSIASLTPGSRLPAYDASKA
ncbi:MAG: SDR family NAD(P)-dependent oxidoreductase, partial [Hyphomonadaceae bacterium]